MVDPIKIAKQLAKLRRLKKLKMLKGATNKATSSGELAVVNRSLSKVESRAVSGGGLNKLGSTSLLKPVNAGSVSGALTSRTARTVEKKLLTSGTRVFPKQIKEAEIVEGAIIAAAKKGNPRAWGVTKKLGRFGLEVAAWGVAGYYFDRAIDYFMGDEDGVTDEGAEDKKGLTAKDAYNAAQLLADEVHGLEDGWPIGLGKSFDLSRDPEFMQLFGDYSEGILRGKLSDSNFSSIRALEGYNSSKIALLIHRATESIKLLASLTDNEYTLKLLAVQSLLSDDTTVVPPMGYQILDDSYLHDDAVEMAADGHFTNIANFVDDYRSDAVKSAFDEMTDFVELVESKNEFLDALNDPTKMTSKLAVYLLASYSNDKFEDVMGMIRSFSVDNDGDDDETAMLNFITRVKQRSYAAISILNKTI